MIAYSVPHPAYLSHCQIEEKKEITAVKICISHRIKFDPATWARSFPRPEYILNNTVFPLTRNIVLMRRNILRKLHDEISSNFYSDLFSQGRVEQD